MYFIDTFNRTVLNGNVASSAFTTLFIKLPGIFLTPLVIQLVYVQARVTMTDATSRNTLDSLLFTAAPE